MKKVNITALRTDACPGLANRFHTACCTGGIRPVSFQLAVPREEAL